MQNEEGSFYHYNVFEPFQDFEIVFWKSDDALLVFVIWDNIVCLYLTVYSKYRTKMIRYDKMIEYEYNRLIKLMFICLLIMSINKMFETEYRKSHWS